MIFTSCCLVLVCRLTAFVNKIFCQAREFHFVDPQVTFTAINWLINNAQSQADGSFDEVFRVHEDNIRVRTQICDVIKQNESEVGSDMLVASIMYLRQVPGFKIDITHYLNELNF